MSKTVLQTIIEKLIADSKYLDGENDNPTDKAVGQYLKTIADDLMDNYLPLEKEQIKQVYQWDRHLSSEEEAEQFYNDCFKK